MTLRSCSMPARALRRLAGFMLLAACAPVLAEPCSVPGSHFQVQHAIDSFTCTAIVLASQSYEESLFIFRTLSIEGADPGNSIVRGRIEIVGAGTAAVLQGLRVESSCTPSTVDVAASAELEAIDLDIAYDAGAPCPPLFSSIFSDGFESGDLSAWQ